MKIVVNNRAEIWQAPPQLQMEMKAELTVSNPLYIEAVRFNRWTGNIPKRLKFYSELDGAILVPRGYAPTAIKKIEAMGVSYEITDDTRVCPEVAFDASCIGAREYQACAIDTLCASRFGVLTAPTGSGKTVMALALIAKRKQPALIIVHTKELLNQWRNRAHEFLGVPKKNIGVIGDGSFKIGDRLTVALVQSLYKRAAEIKHNFGHLIVDECHRAPSRTFTDAVTEFDCRFVLGLSATPYRRDKLSELIFWFLGPLRHAVPEGALIDAGQVMDANVIIRQTGFSSGADLTTQYSEVITDMTENAPRNDMIAHDVKRASDTSAGVALVLTDRVPHCALLRESILRYVKRPETVAILTGKTKKKERESIVELLDTRQIKILIATGQLIGEGFDCKWLANLFLCTPIKFEGRLVQYLGRVLRPAEGKSHAVIYDYVDEQLWLAARERLSVYQK
jgi:superfamily II DNA or RNA helicase